MTPCRPKVGFVVFLLVFQLAGFVQAAAGPTRPTVGTMRAPAPVLLVDDHDTAAADAWYTDFMDSMFGAGNWDRYDVGVQGLPDPPAFFLNTLAQYQAVLWHAGAGGTSLNEAAGPILDYLNPDTPDVPAGRMILVLGAATSLSSILPALLQDGFGVSPVADPVPRLSIPDGSIAYGFGLEATDLVAQGLGIYGYGLQPLAGTEVITRLEPCVRCYSTRPPYDPIVGARRAAVHDTTQTVTALFGVPLDRFANAEAALQDLMKYGMGIIPAAEAVLGADHIRTTINGSGYVGSFFLAPDRPSLNYPYPSHVENMYQGGLWVGARRPDGSVGVSTSSDSYATASEGEASREFAPADSLRIISNIPGSELFDPQAVAPWQAECSFVDDGLFVPFEHDPLGLEVHLRAMSWNAYPYDDAVVLEYRIVNTSGGLLRDLHVGFHADFTVGNTEFNSPYDPSAPIGWNFYDDVNGAWRPGDFADDPANWTMWERDADGDNGHATSWISCRLLAADPPVVPAPALPPVSYNQALFRRWPTADDEYLDPDTAEILPGRYQFMGNGDFDLGVTAEQDFTMASDWSGLLATGPFPDLAAGDSVTVTFALVGGEDAWNLRRNGRRLQELAAAGYVLEASSVDSADTPRRAWLGAAHPNPFNPSTTIRFRLDRPGWTCLEVYGVDGRLVATLLDEQREAGEHTAVWNGVDQTGRPVASGHYLYRLRAPGGQRLVGHMTLVK